MESENKSDWNGPREIFIPISCSKQDQLQSQTELFKVLSSEDSKTSGQLVCDALTQLVDKLIHLQ